MFPDNLDLRPHDSFSVYIHIPFCTRKCGYCDFYSVAGSNQQRIRKTLEQAMTDLQRAVDSLSRRDGKTTIPTLYIGGGTPSIIDPDSFAELLAHTLSILPSVPDEITVEMNPETLTVDHIDICNNTGVDRLSIGIQSFDESVLAYLERSATPEANRKALEALISRFTGDISADLMCGVPAGSASSFDADVAELIAHEPAHVSLYVLTVEDDTPLSGAIEKGMKSPPGADEQAAMWMGGVELLQNAGYQWYEISNFARNDAQKDNRSLHNMGYWRMSPYIGIGPGASSTLASSNGPIRIVASTDIPTPTYTATPIRQDEFLLEHLLMGLRTSEGISRAGLSRIFGVDPFPVEQQTGETSNFDRLIRDELLVDDGDRFAATIRGRQVLDSVLTALAIDVQAFTPTRCNWPFEPGEQAGGKERIG